MSEPAKMAEIELPDGKPWRTPSAHDARMLWREIFEFEVYREAANSLRPEDVILDIGAHIGLWACISRRRYRV